jgi:hypothetical protein
VAQRNADGLLEGNARTAGLFPETPEQVVVDVSVVRTKAS